MGFGVGVYPESTFLGKARKRERKEGEDAPTKPFFKDFWVNQIKKSGLTVPFRQFPQNGKSKILIGSRHVSDRVSSGLLLCLGFLLYFFTVIMADVFFDEISAATKSPISSSKPVTFSLSKPISAPKTFASILRGSDDLDFNLSQLPSPTLRGDVVFVKINEDVYQQQLRKCKNCLLGRLLLRKGSQPMKLDQIKEALQALWKPLNDWHIMPLPKGYYHILFSSEAD